MMGYIPPPAPVPICRQEPKLPSYWLHRFVSAAESATSRRVRSIHLSPTCEQALVREYEERFPGPGLESALTAGPWRPTHFMGKPLVLDADRLHLELGRLSLVEPGVLVPG